MHAHNYYHNYYCRCLQKRNIPFLLPFFSSIIYWSATCKLCIPSLWVNNKTFIQLNKIRMQRLVEIIKKTLYWGTTLYNIRYKIKYVLLSINYKQDEQGLWYQVPKYYFFCLHIPLQNCIELLTTSFRQIFFMKRKCYYSCLLCTLSMNYGRIFSILLFMASNMLFMRLKLSEY